VALLTTVLAKAPLIFLRLSELTNTEVDARIGVGDWTGYSGLNYSRVGMKRCSGLF
jgi:hypothetical protein